MIDEIFEVVGELAAGPPWRYWVCVGPAIILSIFIQMNVQSNLLDWLITVPLVLMSVVVAWVWNQQAAKNK